MNEDDREQVELENLLRSLDPVPRTITAADVIARARSRRLGWGRWAAGIAATLVVAGIASALPGSPVRPWVAAVLDRPAATRPAATGAPHASPDTGRPGGGVTFDPAEPLHVVIMPPLAGHVLVSITDGEELIVRMASGEARFTSEPDRLLVEMLAQDTLELRIPWSAARVDISAGRRRIFLRDGGDVSAAVPPGPDGRYLLPLNGTSR